MIRALKYISNVGRFSEASGAKLQFERMNLIYAENGRGKSTLAAVFRSLASGDPANILERRRLGTTDSPEVIVEGERNHVFDGSHWNEVIPGIAVFDDQFVDDNVHSGLAVDPEHRRNLHSWIIGSEAVALNRNLQALAKKNDEHNSELKRLERPIPEAALNGYEVKRFCELKPIDNIDKLLEQRARRLAASENADTVAKTPELRALDLPSLPTSEIAELLDSSLHSVEVRAMSRVQDHFRTLGPSGERWVTDQIVRLGDGGLSNADYCPFCGQSVAGVDLIGHYRTYFGAEYRALLSRIEDTVTSHQATSSTQVVREFEQGVASLVEGRQFWERYVEISDMAFDSQGITLCWINLHEELRKLLQAKRDRPLEKLELGDQVQAFASELQKHHAAVENVSVQMGDVNRKIAQVKTVAVGEDRQVLERELADLRRVKARYEPSIAGACDDYLREQVAKKGTKQKRDAVRKAFENERERAFQKYPVELNKFLSEFNTEFRVEGLQFSNPRGVPSSEYHLAVAGHVVPLAGARGGGYAPQFRNTLSSGDRRSLALAVFFAGLRRDPRPDQTIAIFDDPAASLDAHRATATAQAIVALASIVRQVVVLSHSKEFLGLLYSVKRGLKVSQMELVNDEGSSVMESWDAATALKAIHDVRHERFAEFVGGKRDELMPIAWSIRPHVEFFLSIVHPDEVDGEKMLGKFIADCHIRREDGDPIMSEVRLEALASLNEYTTKFHHGKVKITPSSGVNEDELRGFVRKTLEFTRMEA